MNIVLALSEDRSICESIKAVLPKGDLVLFEHTLEDGMRRLVSTAADVVILDDSPQFGLEALNALVPQLQGTPILVLTATGGNDVAATFTLAGARGCVQKPFDVKELNRQIKSCVESSETVRPAVSAIPQGTMTTQSVTQHEQALRWMSRNTMYLDNADRLLGSLLDAAIDIFGPARVGILMRGNSGVTFSQSHGIPSSITESITLSFTSGVMRRLESQPSLIDRLLMELEEDCFKEMAAMGAVIAIPLTHQGHTCGALILGEKASGIDYSQSERNLLTTMVSCTSTCLEHSRQHQRISNQQERISAILANISAGVVTVGADHTVTMMNDSAERILQLRAIDIVGNGIIKLGSAFADHVLRTMRDGTPRVRVEILDVSIKANLGLTVTPLGEDGAVVMFSRIPTNEEPSESDISYSPLWEYLATRVAQEIKNPMVPINTYAQLLPTKYDSEDFRVEFSEIVQDSVGRINKVVESIYEFAKHPRLNKHPESMNTAVEHLLTRYGETFKSQDIIVSTRFSEKELQIDVDPMMFNRAVENVLQNSIEAMPEGGTLKIETMRENGSCLLSIEDTGEGINDKDVPLIFMPFFSTKENGMGLGLTMADRIIKEHDGKIELDTKSAAGGRFVFRLPSAAETK